MQSNSFLLRFYKILDENKIGLVYLPLVLYWVVIFILTTIPTDAVPQLFQAQDKFEHLAAYFVLAVLLSLTLHFQKKKPLLLKSVFAISLFLIM